MKDKKSLMIVILSGVMAVFLIVSFIFTVIKQDTGKNGKVM